MRLTVAFVGLLASVICGSVGLATVSAEQVGSAAAAAPTFSKDVAPIFYAKCVTCHRAGEIGPMSLITYREVRPWAASIRDKVSSRVMPPWHADPEHGSFRNDRSLSASEIDTVVRWVNAGSPEGNPSELPKAPQFADGWQIGKPDVVFEMATEYEIPARGTIDYQYFEVPTNFTQDMWIQAGEARAGDRAHVHHIIVSAIEPPGTTRPSAMTVRPILSQGAAPPVPAAPAAPAAGRGAGRALTDQQRAAAAARAGANMLVNWAVGEDAPVHADGTAKRIPAGSPLVVQIHYTTNGTPGKDRSRVGFIFSKTPPAREVRTGLIANPMFAIPPGDANHLVEAEATFTNDVKVWTMHPHMHFRGKDMTYTATYPDGRKEVVLRVPRYDFNWQGDYWLKEPLALPKGSTLRVTAHFDNSTANKANPNPSETVRWGDQTWEEMMIGFITYTVESTPAASTTARR
jgi:hypothetical protein